jgi:ADP-ribosylglycohydrolase
VAAGDAAGGASAVGYSALTQQATVVAYHLLSRNGISGPDLVTEWAELGADGTNPSVYRGASPDFENWLTNANTAEQRRLRDPGCEPAARVVPVGVWFRRDPSALVDAALEVSRLTHMDATTAIASATLAGAVAACCFGQSGRDLIAAVNETASLAAIRVAEETEGFIDAAASGGFVSAARAMRPTGLDRAELGSPAPGWVLEAIQMVATPSKEPDEVLGKAAHIGGSLFASLVGALLGARHGFRNWPWTIPNTTWFAELGLRLVSGNREIRDLPVPYYVEEALTHGIDRDYQRPFR